MSLPIGLAKAIIIEIKKEEAMTTIKTMIACLGVHDAIIGFS